ncbi:arginine--tRNA ligase [Actinomadura vinacea]|uniref:arginine--tRNA ligase n=1 Tax=Actinomadura vinacea TaxID=115336 RepID=A0ABN3KG08_9ACTN
MNELAKLNAIYRHEIESLRDSVKERRQLSAFPAAAGYPLANLKARITRALEEHSGRTDLRWELDILDRAKMGADIAIRVTGLLKEFGAKEYIGSHVPWIVEAVRGPDLSDVVDEVAHKGIYVNIRLADAWYLKSVQAVVDLDQQFGLNDSRADRTYVVDYSSPNVAKRLHAGHLRSTMIGHVLTNLYKACGGLVYRVNHINDFGGFGFMLEGYRRFHDRFPASMGENDRLLSIYAIRRSLERAVEAGVDLDVLPATDREVIDTYFPDVKTAGELKMAYEQFVAASDARFQKLEEGDADEVALWERMVAWSLEDFQSFYRALDIEIDFTMGESFYADAGNQVVDEAIEAGRAYRLTRDMVDQELTRLDGLVENDELTSEARDQAATTLAKDLDAIVVPLADGERLVVRRSDGRSIYATRDMGAIRMRREIFDPSDIVYVVGQEQRVHFSRVFQAAETLGLVKPGEVSFRHIPFGFYVDAETGKKLSSRDSVASVNDLLAESVEHYRAKTAEGSNDLSPAEVEQAARQLAVGAVFFNDLKKDMKGTVPIPQGDLAPVIAEFEKSGGPYVVYSAVRARSILRRYGKALPKAADIDAFTVDSQEGQLLLRLFEYPEKVAKAAAEDNPSILVRHLLDLAILYNSYYTVAPVLQKDQVNEFRLLITKAVELTLARGLSLCHVECPPQI